ncbi:MAG: sensor histidine kinase [Ferrovibrio sp.]
MAEGLSEQIRRTASIHYLASGAEDEENRLVAVRRFDTLEIPRDEILDHIAASAADLLAMPVSAISVVDHDRIWFRARHGLEIDQTSRDPGLCASAILHSNALLLPDTLNDSRARSNPLVTSSLGIRFYLGIPLRTQDGFTIGTLCVMDRKPGSATDRQIASLSKLASIAMNHLELGAAARRLVAQLSKVIVEKDQALTQAALLAQEIDHRVMNSLQLVSGLLTLQSKAQPDGDTKLQLMQAAGRVNMIAMVHRHIYLTEGIGETNCRGYLQRVCHDLSAIPQAVGRGDIEVTSDDATLATDQIVALGLIVNELLTNAIKYGEGRISVDFIASQNGCVLTVGDEGPGLPEGKPPPSRHGLGMTVIAALVTRLKGELKVISRPNAIGARFIVTFPAEMA